MAIHGFLTVFPWDPSSPSPTVCLPLIDRIGLSVQPILSEGSGFEDQRVGDVFEEWLPYLPLLTKPFV